MFLSQCAIISGVLIIVFQIFIRIARFLITKLAITNTTLLSFIILPTFFVTPIIVTVIVKRLSFSRLSAAETPGQFFTRLLYGCVIVVELIIITIGFSFSLSG